MRSNPEGVDVVGNVMRDVAVGLVGAYICTVTICLLGMGADLKIALVGSLLPALFSGPFVGILLSLRRFMADQQVADAAAWDLATVHPLREEPSDPAATAA